MSSPCISHLTKIVKCRINSFPFDTKFLNKLCKRYKWGKGADDDCNKKTDPSKNKDERCKIEKNRCKESDNSTKETSNSDKNEKGGNLSVVLTKVNEIILEDRPKPTPTAKQALIQIEVVGICRTDLEFWQKGKVGPLKLEKPIVLGHECSGTILSCGDQVKNFSPGDHVAIEPGVPCRTCEYCKTGRYNLCPAMEFCGTPPVNGTLCRYFCIDADFCFPLPSHVSFEEGALCAPLACAVHANKLAHVRLGSVCLIQGAGPLGLCTAAVAKVNGASKVLITDMLEYRLKIAKDLGVADFTLNVHKIEEIDVAIKILELLKEEPHATFECAGSQTAARVGLHVTKAGGIVVLLALGGEDMTLPCIASLLKEITVIGARRFVNDFEDCVELFSSKKINLKPLGTHHFRLEDSVKAFEVLKDKKGNPLKIFIHCNSKWNSNAKC